MNLDIDRLHKNHGVQLVGRRSGKTVAMAAEALNTALLLEKGQCVVVWCPHFKWAVHTAKTIFQVGLSMGVEMEWDDDKRTKIHIIESGAFIRVTVADKNLGGKYTMRGYDYVELFDH